MEWARERSEGVAVPDLQPRGWPAHRQSPAPGERLCSHPTARADGRHHHQDGNHTFRATGVTAYLKNGGTLEKAAQMANHASTRTTQLCDRRTEEVTLDEVEWILV